MLMENMRVTMSMANLWNLCYHSYMRGVRHEMNGRVSKESFGDFFRSEADGDNGLLEHMKELEKRGELVVDNEETIK